MTWLIDLTAILGACAVVAGVFLGYGLPPALICGGVLMIAFALKAAKVYEESHVIDGEAGQGDQ